MGDNINLGDSDFPYIDMKISNNPQELDAPPEVTAPKNFPDCSSSSKELKLLDPACIQEIRKLENRPKISNILNKITKSGKRNKHGLSKK